LTARICGLAVRERRGLMKAPGSAEGAAPARTRPVLHRLSLFLVAVAFAVFAASALAGSHTVKGAFQINSSITNADPVVTGPRYTSSSQLCGTSATETTLAGTYHYKVYRFRAVTRKCITVALLVHSGTAAVTGYRSIFNPTSPGDSFGTSTGGLGAGQMYEVEYDAAVLAAGTFDVVVWETTQNGGASYSLLVEGQGILMIGGGGPTVTASLQSFRASSAPKGVLVRWRTRSEHEALGFNLYRGAAKKVRLTRSMVRASGDGRGHTYSYLDRSTRKGKAAPYYLEVVQRGGSKIMFGPARR
jgi:hypothetical protein